MAVSKFTHKKPKQVGQLTSPQSTLLINCNYSANNAQSHIRITGWKTFYHDDNYTVTYHENNLVSFQVHNSNSYSLTTSWKEFGYTWLTDAFRPVNPVKFFTGDNIICAISDNSSTLKYRSLSGNATSQLWGNVIYKRKG